MNVSASLIYQVLCHDAACAEIIQANDVKVASFGKIINISVYEDKGNTCFFYLIADSDIDFVCVGYSFQWRKEDAVYSFFYIVVTTGFYQFPPYVCITCSGTLP